MTRYVAGVVLLALPLAGRAQQPRVAEQQSGTKALLQAVSAVNEKVVWVSGHSGAVLRTVDGGDTWQPRTVPDAGRLEFRDVQAASADEAWLLSAGPGPASRIYHTVDGGATWTQQFANTDSAAFYDCLTFFDRKRGVVFGDAIGDRTMMLRTTDGGAHWSLLDASTLPTALKNEGGFAASGGCLVSHGKRGWVATGAPSARLLRSDDAGQTWHEHATPFVRGTDGGMTATAWRDGRNGIGVAAVIGKMGRDTASASVGITTDGGATWTLRNRPPVTGAIFGVTWVPKAGKSTVVAASLGGVVSSPDAGLTWTVLNQFQYWSVGSSGKRAWAVGPGGRITRVEFGR